MAENTDQVFVRVALRKKKGKIYTCTSSRYYIDKQQIIKSTYSLNIGRKYRSSCCQSGIKKEKRKDI